MVGGSGVVEPDFTNFTKGGSYAVGPKAVNRGPKVRFWGRGTKPPNHQLGGLGSDVSFQQGAEPRPPKGFTLLSAPRMDSPDTVKMLHLLSVLIIQTLLAAYKTQIQTAGGSVVK